MIGWGLFITLLVLVLGFFGEMNSGLGNAFGYPSKRVNWRNIFWMLQIGWALLVAFKFGILKF